ILKQGLMPSYQGKLTSDQINDIVSYLTSIPLNDTSGSVDGKGTYERILHADREPHNWLTYGGDFFSQRYSGLTQVTRANVNTLTLKWVWRPRYLDKMETTPLVVDGVMYAVQN